MPPRWRLFPCSAVADHDPAIAQNEHHVADRADAGERVARHRQHIGRTSCLQYTNVVAAQNARGFAGGGAQRLVRRQPVIDQQFELTVQAAPKPNAGHARIAVNHNPSPRGATLADTLVQLLMDGRRQHDVGHRERGRQRHASLRAGWLHP
jgi:hypothetical protein